MLIMVLLLFVVLLLEPLVVTLERMMRLGTLLGII